MRELSLNILDIAQNSISAGASLITIDVSESREEHLLTLTVSDNGCGMDEEQLLLQLLGGNVDVYVFF